MLSVQQSHTAATTCSTMPRPLCRPFHQAPPPFCCCCSILFYTYNTHHMYHCKHASLFPADLDDHNSWKLFLVFKINFSLFLLISACIFRPSCSSLACCHKQDSDPEYEGLKTKCHCYQSCDITLGSVSIGLNDASRDELYD